MTLSREEGGIQGVGIKSSGGMEAEKSSHVRSSLPDLYRIMTDILP